MPSARLAKVSVRTAAGMTSVAVHAAAMVRTCLAGTVRIFTAVSDVSSGAVARVASIVRIDQTTAGDGLRGTQFVYRRVTRVVTGAMRGACLVKAVVNCTTIFARKSGRTFARVVSPVVCTGTVRGAGLLVAVVNDCVCVCGRNFQRTLPCHQY